MRGAAGRRAVVVIAAAASVVLAACTGLPAPPAPSTTASVSAYLGGDIERLPLTGDPRRPTAWTLPASPSPVQRELDVATQRWEALESVLAFSGGLKPQLYPLYWSISMSDANPPSFPPDNPATLLEGGIVWERIYVAKTFKAANGETIGRTIVCRDQRYVQPVSPGTDVTKYPAHVRIDVYLWVKSTTSLAPYGRTLRWRAIDSDGDSRPISPAECNAWAKTHHVWNGPSAG
jgi:hypothetical protein